MKRRHQRDLALRAPEYQNASFRTPRLQSDAVRRLTGKDAVVADERGVVNRS